MILKLESALKPPEKLVKLQITGLMHRNSHSVGLSGVGPENLHFSPAPRRPGDPHWRIPALGHPRPVGSSSSYRFKRSTVRLEMPLFSCHDFAPLFKFAVYLLLPLWLQHRESLAFCPISWLSAPHQLAKAERESL